MRKNQWTFAGAKIQIEGVIIMAGFKKPKFGKKVPSKRIKQVLPVLTAALDAVEPRQASRDHVRIEKSKLIVDAKRGYNLNKYSKVYVIGGGKAGAPMASALKKMLGKRVKKVAVNVKYGHLGKKRVKGIKEAGHPIPDANGVAGSKIIAELAKKADKDTLVLCVISGGGSALMCLPEEPITLKEYQNLTKELQSCGATINEINSVRKHIEQLKGGKLAELASKATLVTLVLSDVVGNPPDVIASGPTVPDRTTFADACGVMDRYNLWAKEDLYKNIADHLREGKKGNRNETPKEGNTTEEGDDIFAGNHYCLIGSNEITAKAAFEEARKRKFKPLLLSSYIEGEAREVGKVLAGIGKAMASDSELFKEYDCVIVGGETTVSLPDGCWGRGGRNQEMALSAAIALDGVKNVMVVCLATDGTDGPTDAAGAIAHGETVARARAKGMDPYKYLENHDSYHFFAALGDTLMTGPTNTNVNDLYFVFSWNR